MTKLYRVLGKRGRITIPYEIRQRVALVHLSVKWAEQKTQNTNI